MGTFGRLADPDVRTASADMLMQYELMEECILSGQVSEDKVHGMVRSDPAFGRWLRARMTDRALLRARSPV